MGYGFTVEGERYFKILDQKTCQKIAELVSGPSALLDDLIEGLSGLADTQVCSQINDDMWELENWYYGFEFFAKYMDKLRDGYLVYVMLVDDTTNYMWVERSVDDVVKRVTNYKATKERK